MAEETVTYDVEGYEIVTEALKALLIQFPKLEEDETIRFSTLGENSGISFYPASGAVIAEDKRTITGKVDQLCNYPFYIVYRTAIDNPDSKADVKEFLDYLGKWLEQQPILVDGESVVLTEYPELTDGRKIEEIARQTPAYLEAVNQNNAQDWVISLNLQYRNTFYPYKDR